MNMAIDEAVLEAISREESEPTLRLYGWNPAAISLGYFQSLSEEIDEEACKKNNVDVVRRMTGGGAVFHEHEITYSIHIPEKSEIVPTGILESYRRISDGILEGLTLFGINGQFVPLNDIVVPFIMSDDTTQMRKISGNAQTRKQGIIVQHGTILLKVDVEKMFSLLKVPSEKLKGKLIEDIKQRVTGLSHVLGHEVSFESAQDAFIKGFKKAFSQTKFEAGELSINEINRAKELVAEKYNNDSWNRMR